MKIPFVDLQVQYQNHKKDIDDAINSVIRESAFIKGKYVSEFERDFAKRIGIRNCVGVANGTDAIYITLKMLGVGTSDEVITTALSWISTSETISQAGAKPVFVDINDNYLMDVNKIEASITQKTKAIIPVHIYGQACEMNKIISIAEKHNLLIIEDCAQAHFATYKGKKVGTFGVAATYSFYPGKNLGAYGDAGAITTDNDLLAEKCRMYANHGALIKHHHEMEGINSRLDGLQAAILTAKLKYINKWNEERLNKAKLYNSLLKGINQITTPHISEGLEHIFHVYCIQAENRENLRSYLHSNEIETQIHYPTMLPFMPAYKYLGHSEVDFPKAFFVQHRILSLPMYPELTFEQISFIVNKIKEFYSNEHV